MGANEVRISVTLQDMASQQFQKLSQAGIDTSEKIKTSFASISKGMNISRSKEEMVGVKFGADSDQARTAAVTGLNQRIDMQKEKLILLNSTLETTATNYRATSNAAQKFITEIEREELALTKMQQQLRAANATQIMTPKLQAIDKLSFGKQSLQTDMQIKMTKFDDGSLKSYTAQSQFLNQIIAKQREIVTATNSAHQASAAIKGRDAAETQKLQQRLQQEQLTLAQLEKQLRLNATAQNGMTMGFGDKIGNMRMQLATLFTVLATGGGLFTFVKAAIDAGNAVYILSAKMHMSVEEAVGLNKILKMSDIDSQSFITTMIRLDKQVMEAGTGGNLITNSLKEFGISLTDSTGKLLPYNQQLEQLAKGYQEAAKTGQEAEFVSQTLGPRGASLVPLLQQYNDLAEAAARIKTTTLLDPKMAHEMSIEMKVLNGEADQLKMAFGAALLPVAKEIAPEVIDGLQKMVEEVKNNKGEIIDTAKGVIGISKDIIGAIKGVAGALSPVVSLFEKLNSMSSGFVGGIVTVAAEFFILSKLGGMSAKAVGGLGKELGVTSEKLKQVTEGTKVGSMATSELGMMAIAVLPGWLKLAGAIYLATTSLKGWIEQKEIAESKRLGSNPDEENAKIRYNDNTGKYEKEVLDKTIAGKASPWLAQHGQEFTKWVEFSDEENKAKEADNNKKAMIIARRQQLESIVEASTGKPLDKSTVDEKIKDEFDDKYSTEKWKANQNAQVAQKKLIDKEKADTEKSLQSELFKLTHSETENEIHDLDEKYKTFKEKLGDSITLTEWAAASRAKIEEKYAEKQQEMQDKIFKLSHTQRQNELLDIERESEKNKKPNSGYNSSMVDELAVAQRKKVNEDALKQQQDIINKTYKLKHTDTENSLRDIKNEAEDLKKSHADDAEYMQRVTEWAETAKAKIVHDKIQEISKEEQDLTKQREEALKRQEDNTKQTTDRIKGYVSGQYGSEIGEVKKALENGMSSDKVNDLVNNLLEKRRKDQALTEQATSMFSNRVPVPDDVINGDKEKNNKDLAGIDKKIAELGQNKIKLQVSIDENGLNTSAFKQAVDSFNDKLSDTTKAGQLASNNYFASWGEHIKNMQAEISAFQPGAQGGAVRTSSVAPGITLSINMTVNGEADLVKMANQGADLIYQGVSNLLQEGSY